MKIATKTVCVILCCAVIASGTSLFSFAQQGAQPEGCYPIIFVHGLNGWGSAEGIDDVIPYWGATTGSLVGYLRGEGYECYSASVGPISSAWDRACELYAQLAGTTVDYGAAHSEKYGHLRYGRTYEKGLIDNWGELDAEGRMNKVHIIGHSFGGTTARMLVQLLAQGSAEERAASPDDCSPLFEGGHGDMVRSVTCVCTPHNSSTIYYPAKILGVIDTFKVASVLYVGAAGRSFMNGRYVDFHMEQFGLSYIPGEKNADAYFTAVKRVLDNSDDIAAYDLTPEGSKKLNEYLDVQEGIYYYSYAFSTTKRIEPLNVSIPIVGTNPVIAMCSLAMGITMYLKDFKLDIVYGPEWQENDALVNTLSEKYPFGEPHTDYDASAQVQTGIWNVMPVQKGDHGTAIGLLAEQEPTQQFYLELARMLSALPE